MNGINPHKLKFYFNHIYIIQSLDENENTGKWLYEDIMNYKYVHEVLDIEFIIVKSREDFFLCLEKIKEDITIRKRMPLIHLEAHGDEKGFEFRPSKEEITWMHFLKEITKINVLSRNNLFLALGICFGAYSAFELFDLIAKHERSPFLLLIAPQTEISGNDIKYGYSRFYNKLFESPTVQAAIESMREVTGLNYLQTTSYYIEKIIKELNHLTNSKEFKIETSSQLNELIRKGKLPLPDKTYQRNLKYMRGFKKDFYAKKLRISYERFLMIDLYKENRERFKDFNELWSDQS